MLLVSGDDDDLSGEAESNTPQVLAVLSVVLERLVARNDRVGLEEPVEGLDKEGMKAFQGVRAPSISISKYLERIYKYTNCSPSCFVVGYIYMDRLVHKHPDLLVSSLNVHRLLVTSVMVASKFLEEVHYNNAFYARVGGVSNVELNRLELELLFLLDFRLMVSLRVFESYCLHLEKEMMMWGGINQRIDRTLSNSADDQTEISVGEIARGSSSPPPQVID